MSGDLLGDLLYIGTFGAVDINKQQRDADSAKKSAEDAAKNQDLGNLTKEEASAGASKKMFRQGLYFTSPTGLSGSGTRGRSRLMGK